MHFGSVPNLLISELLPDSLKNSYLSIHLSTYTVSGTLYELWFLVDDLDAARPWSVTIRWDSRQQMLLPLIYLFLNLGCSMDGLYEPAEQRKILDSWLATDYSARKVYTNPKVSFSSYSF